MPTTLRRWFDERHDAIIDSIAQLVNMDSPTWDKEATDRLGGVLRTWLEEAGAQVEVFPQEKVGDHLLARWPAAEAGAEDSGTGGPLDHDLRPVLLLCHMDTVYNTGDAAARPFRIDGPRAYGPGAYDMKGGIALGLWAVRGLRSLGRALRRPIWMLITSDEEVGSPTSRELIEDTARQCAAVLVLEPGAGPDGPLKTWRKGVGMFHLVCHGRSAHAGADPEKGISAVEELAHQVIRLHGLTDLEAGTTVNVGVVSGGTRTNVIAERAEAHVDIRVMKAEEGERLEQIIKGLEPVLPGARLEVSGGLNRPPMERTESTAALFQAAQRAGRDVGVEVTETGTGGGSDGNFTAALGVPTLDGLGVSGDSAHSPDEHILLDPIPGRAALLARLLETL